MRGIEVDYSKNRIESIIVTASTSVPPNSEHLHDSNTFYELVDYRIYTAG